MNGFPQSHTQQLTRGVSSIKVCPDAPFWYPLPMMQSGEQSPLKHLPPELAKLKLRLKAKWVCPRFLAPTASLGFSQNHPQFGSFTRMTHRSQESVVFMLTDFFHSTEKQTRTNQRRTHSAKSRRVPSVTLLCLQGHVILLSSTCDNTVLPAAYWDFGVHSFYSVGMSLHPGWTIKATNLLPRGCPELQSSHHMAGLSDTASLTLISWLA